MIFFFKKNTLTHIHAIHSVLSKNTLFDVQDIEIDSCCLFIKDIKDFLDHSSYGDYDVTQPILHIDHFPCVLSKKDFENSTRLKIICDLFIKFKKKFLIFKNQIVTCQCYFGSTSELRFPCQSLQSGYKGQIIKVKNINTKKEFKVKVIDNNTVLLKK
jgi:hypothetical protein